MPHTSTLRSHMRSLLPFSLWQTVGFISRIPSYRRVDRSEALRIRNRDLGLPLYVTPDVSVVSPESVTAYINWQKHGVEINDSSAEALEFLDLSRDRKCLFDIGAQTGFMSALFARSRSTSCRILSIEPDPLVLPVLERAVALNRGLNCEWTIAQTAVSDIEGRMSLPLSNRLYENRAQPIAPGSSSDVPVTTLSHLISTINMPPDIIKIDVESFEHEILCSSLGPIEHLKPALQLEVHWKMLEQRGRMATDFLGPLAALGYRGLRRRYRTLGHWLRAGRSEPVSRIALSAS